MSTITGIPKLPETKHPPRTDSSSPSPNEPEESKNFQPGDLKKSVEENHTEVGDKVTASNFATYEEAMAVAGKLQSRINEVADIPHKVTIRADNDAGHYIIEIKDREGNVVKRFPSEKILNLHQKLDDLSGMVIDEMI